MPAQTPHHHRLVVLRGGSRDGESTTVEADVTRLYAASEAPGMIDVYEPSGEREHLRGNEEPSHVYGFVGRAAAAEIAPELIHMPDRR